MPPVETIVLAFLSPSCFAITDQESVIVLEMIKLKLV